MKFGYECRLHWHQKTRIFPQRDFLKLRRNFNVNARSNLAGIIRVFGHVVRDLQRNHPTAARDVMRNA